MIKAYLAGVESLHEGDSIEVRYSVYEDEALLREESVMMDYKKPAIVGEFALIVLLKRLKKYIDKDIVIIINDPALYEIVKGTSTTKNNDVLKTAVEMRKELAKFSNIVIKDAGKDQAELKKWKEILWD